MAIHIHFQEMGILPKMGHQFVAMFDWLSGPPMTEHERITRAVEQWESESDTLKQLGTMGL